MATPLNFGNQGMETKASCWQTIFSILGPFDLYGAGGTDPLQRSRRELVLQIFRLVDYPENLEVSVAALHVIADMAESPAFASTGAHTPHKLYSILESAGELPAVLEAFIRRLEREETEQISLMGNINLGNWREEGENTNFIASFGLSNLIRLQILEFFIKNAAKTGYNLAHYLLGFGSELLAGAAGSLALPSQSFNCLHLILELLAYGLGHPSTPIVALDHPSLGQKCYELIVVLLSDLRTNRATANYLRDQEDFFRKQLVFMARVPVDPGDIGYSIFEMQQKAALLRGALFDMHLAIADGAWSYARKLSSVIVHGIIGEKDKDNGREALEAGQSLVALIMSSVETTALELDGFGGLPAHVQEQLLVAAGVLVNSTVKIAQLMLHSLNRIPYDLQAILLLQSHLVTSLVPVVGRLLSHHSSTQVILECCAALSTSISGDFFRRSNTQISTILAGDELYSLVTTAITGILRTDVNIAARGYLYSVICEAISLITTSSDSPGHSQVTQALRKDINRLLEVAATDSVVAALDADGWKTMATTFLRTLLDLLADAAPLDHLIRIGFVKNFIGSLRTDDKTMLNVLNPASTTLNSLYLWQARFALLQKVVLLPEVHGGERLIEGGLIDIISSFRVWDWQQTDHTSNNNFSLIEQRWYQIMLPVVRLLLLLYSNPTASIRSPIACLVISRMSAFEEIMRSNSRRLSSSEEHCELISFTLRLLTQVVSSPSSVQSATFGQLLVKAANNKVDDQLDQYSTVILSSIVQFFTKEMLNNDRFSFISSSDDALESLSRTGKLPIGIFMRIIDGVIEMLNLDNFSRSLPTIEGFLLILTLFVERSQKEHDIRQISAAVSPSLEQLQSVIQKISSSSKEKFGLSDRLLKDLRVALSKPVSVGNVDLNQ